MLRCWLSDLRGDRSQQAIADLAAISQNYYSAIETGSRNPSVKVAKRIATALGFHWQRFFEDPGNEPKTA